MSAEPRRIEDIIEACVALKKGNKELMMYRCEDGWWTVEMGNPVSCVQLGESSGEIQTEADNLMEALEDMENLLLYPPSPVGRSTSPQVPEDRLPKVTRDILADLRRRWREARGE